MTKVTEDEQAAEIFKRNEANILVSWDLLSVKINVMSTHGGIKEAQDTTKVLIKKVRAAQKELHKSSVQAIIRQELSAESPIDYDVRDAQ